MKVFSAISQTEKRKIKMKIDIDRLARLSMLSFSEEEKAVISADIEEIVYFAERISEYSESTKLDILFFPHGEQDALRDDTPSVAPSREALLSAASSRCDGYISVPLVIGEEEGNA